MGISESERFGRFKSFPRLETERLVLREITTEDAEWYLKHFSTNEIVYGQGYPAPKGIKEAMEELQLYFIDLFNSRNGFRWGIQLKGETGLIGSCGFYKWTRPDGRQAEMGYDLNPKYWRRGIMSEAMKAIINFGFEQMQLNRIEITIMPRNYASITLALKLGFKKEGILREHGLDENRMVVDDVIFSMLRRDWLELRRKK